MSANYTGKSYVVIQDFSYDPEIGLFTEPRIRGIPSVVAGFANGYVNTGYSVQLTQDGPYSELTARRYAIPTTGQFIIRWSISTDAIEKDLFTLPDALSEADAYDTIRGPGQYRKGIEEAVADGEALDSSYASYPYATSLWLELARGVESYEESYMILTRSIQYSVNRPTVLELQTNREFYSTSRLVANEGIPSDVLFDLPTDLPADQTQAVWGWRISDQRASIDSELVATHETSWTLAQWSTLSYTYVP